MQYHVSSELFLIIKPKSMALFLFILLKHNLLVSTQHDDGLDTNSIVSTQAIQNVINFIETSQRNHAEANTGNGVNINFQSSSRLNNNNNHRFTISSPFISPPHDACLSRINCNNFYQNKYRSIDGTCNNINTPRLGSTNRPYRKVIPSEYYKFGSLYLPRGGKNPSILPSPRNIRLQVHFDSNVPDERLSTTIMTFGQFISHTIIHTTAQELQEDFNTCCISHTRNDSCFPITIPSYDSFFQQFGVHCRNFKRSPAYCPQNGGLRLQMNTRSSFLDASTVYGTDLTTTNRLRLFKGGLMRMGEHSLLPDLQLDLNLFDSGDARSNQNPMLAGMHTIWLREHNRIATELGSINWNWSDEELFQESRQILIAEFQNVIYNEYLRLLFTPRIYYQLELNTDSKDYTSYDPNIDPSVTAEMSGAAFRMGHSMVNGDQGLFINGELQRGYKIGDHFFRPKDLIKTSNDLDMLIEGITITPNQKVDQYITNELANRFGKPFNLSYGQDLVSTNIQRGRDHGIPNYNTVRNFCKLPTLSFNSKNNPPNGIQPNAWKAIKNVYRSADDIDLFTGGLSEISLESSVLGPTFTCILSAEFYRHKFGDRYFFTHDGQSGSFTTPQLQMIKQRRLFDIFCDNTNIRNLAPSVFEQPIGRNLPVPCSTRRRLNLRLFE